MYGTLLTCKRLNSAAIPCDFLTCRPGAILARYYVACL